LLLAKPGDTEMTIAAEIIKKIDTSKNEADQLLEIAPVKINQQGILGSKYGEYKGWMYIVFTDESVVFYSHDKVINGSDLLTGNRTRSPL
jgi:hypothetical protein